MLVLGQRERERRLERVGLVARHLDARRSLARAGSARLRQYELQREELIVRGPDRGPAAPRLGHPENAPP